MGPENCLRPLSKAGLSLYTVSREEEGHRPRSWKREAVSWHRSVWQKWPVEGTTWHTVGNLCLQSTSKAVHPPIECG